MLFDEAKAFIDRFGIDNGPLCGRVGVEFLSRMLNECFNRPFDTSDDLFQAMLAVREISNYYGMTCYRVGDPEPPASRIITKDEFLTRFHKVTNCKAEFLPVIRYVLDKKAEGNLSVWKSGSSVS